MSETYREKEPTFILKMHIILLFRDIVHTEEQKACEIWKTIS